MLTRTCDICNLIILDNDTIKNSTYTFSIKCNSMFNDYISLEKLDLCYNCTMKSKKAIEKYFMECKKSYENKT
jgi:hypothetical protein